MSVCFNPEMWCREVDINIMCRSLVCRVEVGRKWNHVTVSKEANSTLAMLGQTVFTLFRESMLMKADHLRSV